MPILAHQAQFLARHGGPLNKPVGTQSTAAMNDSESTTRNDTNLDVVNILDFAPLKPAELVINQDPSAVLPDPGLVEAILATQLEIDITVRERSHPVTRKVMHSEINPTAGAVRCHPYGEDGLNGDQAPAGIALVAREACGPA